MKRPFALLLSLALVLALFAACGKQEETPSDAAPQKLTFTRENMPRLDGSTSTVPLALAVCAELLGESREEVQDLVRFNKTTTAYFNLLEGNADLLIVGEANDEVMARKMELGFEWEKQPFATDAFVFVVNEDNPVDSITVAQARDIYSGKITNWSELGGEDRPITALQRNEGAGSQTLMEKLVMQGTPMMEAPTEYIVTTMGQLMEAVKSFDGSPGAIGYSVYYYAEEMKMAQGLKLLKLEGVEPSPDTIRSETYPLVNPKYVVIPANEPKDAPNKVLFDWLLSEEGQTLIAKEGYVSILDVGTFPKTVPQTGTRLSEGYMGELKAADDGYGLLVPYAGRRLMDDWPAATGCLYGLMTLDGTAVTDAVYSNVFYPSYYENYEQHPLSVIALVQGQKSNGIDGFEERYTVAASDGSWVMEEAFRALSTSRYGLLLLGDDSLTVTDVSGEVTQRLSYQKMGLSDEDVDHMISSLMWGGDPNGRRSGDRIALGWVDDSYQNIRYYDLSTGESGEMAWDAFDALDSTPDGDYAEPVYAIEDAYRMTDEALGSGAPGLLFTQDYSEDGMTVSYYRDDGTPLEGLTLRGESWYRQVALRGGLVELLDLNTASYYNLETMDCVFETYLGYEAD